MSPREIRRGRLGAIFLALLALLAAAPVRAGDEIPNGDFERWTDFGPLDFGAFQPPNLLFRTVHRSEDAHSGDAAVRLANLAFFGQVVNGGIFSCPGDCRSGPGGGQAGFTGLTFPVTRRHRFLCGHYKARLEGGDRVLVALALRRGQQILAGTDQGDSQAAFLTESPSEWTPFRIPITDVPGLEAVVPTGANLQVAIFGPGYPSDPTDMGSAGSQALIDDLSFCEPEVDLVIRHAEVLGGQEVPEAVEESLGAQTFVNLDNDDGDELFDTNPRVRSAAGARRPDDHEVPGDDELVRLELRLRPRGEVAGEARLEVLSGGETVKLWRTGAKVAELDPELDRLPLPGDFEQRGEAWVQELWVEGLRSHSEPRSVVLRLTYDRAPGHEDRAALTVLGVQELRWRGHGNGYTPDGAHDGDVLDGDPNFDAVSDIGSRRVFPGARHPHTERPRDRVSLEVELTTEPVHHFALKVKAFDIDDPARETGWLDPNDTGCGRDSCEYRGTNLHFTSEEDNRGAPEKGGKAGYLEGQNSQGIGSLPFTRGQRTAEVSFRVSLHPGDSYQVVAYPDEDFLLALRNLDQEDGFFVVDPRVAPEGRPWEREIRERPSYASPVLTVWRLLHIERDSMAAVAASGWQRNVVEGNVLYVQRGPGGEPAFYVATDVDFTQPQGPRAPLAKDLSKNLENGGNGRFEGGVVDIGGARTSDLRGNGPDYLSKVSGIEVPVTVTAPPAGPSAGLPVLQGRVEESFETRFQVAVDKPLRPGYVGGTLRVAGVPMEIRALDASSSDVFVKKLEKIPFILWDDDDLTLLPSLPSLAGMDTYRSAYLLPLDDGGGQLSDNQEDLDFVLNVGSKDATQLAVYDPSRQSRRRETDHFWTVYVASAYQYAAAVASSGSTSDDKPDVGDEDPAPSEIGVTAFTTPICDAARRSAVSDDHLAAGGWGTLIFLETEREVFLQDRTDPISDVLRDHPTNVAHEIGHQFGLGHGQGGLMKERLTGGSELSEKSIHFIRSRVESPGGEKLGTPVFGGCPENPPELSAPYR